MNTEDSEFARIEHEALLRAAQLVQPEQEPVAWQWLDVGVFRKRLPATSEPEAWRPLYTSPPQEAQPAQPVRPRLDQGPDYERGFVDGMQYQMQSSVDKAVNAGAKNLRDWVAERMDKESEQPVQPVKEIMQMALDALEEHEYARTDKSLRLGHAAIGAIRAALAQPEQEPVALAKRILELEAMLERQTARIVDLQTHIENFEGEDT